jgi:hypothetical protein
MWMGGSLPLGYDVKNRELGLRGPDGPVEVHDRRVMFGKKAPGDFRPKVPCSPKKTSGVTSDPGSAE